MREALCRIAFGLVVAASCVSHAPAQTPFARATDLLQKVTALAGVGDAAANEADRRDLLARADALCDEAAAAGADVFALRWQLAKQAYDAAAWAVAAALYDDCVAAFGDDAVGALECKRLAGASRSLWQQTLPFAERDFAPALQRLGDVADLRQQLLERALAAPGSGKLAELEAAADARREFGVTLLLAGQRDRARTELERAHALLCTHVARLARPDLLRTICADLQDVDEGASKAAMERTEKVLGDSFPEATDLLVDMRIEAAVFMFNRGQRGEAAEMALRIAREAEQVQTARPQVMLHTWAQTLRLLVQASRYAEAQPILARALRILEEQRLNARTGPARVVLHQQAELLVQQGRDAEGFAMLDRILAEAPGSADIWQRRGRLKMHAGDYAQALADSLQALSLMPTGERRYQCLANIAMIHGRDGRVGLALACFEELVDEVRRRPPQSADYHLGRALLDLGDLRYELGDFRGAEPLLDEALRLIEAREGPDGAKTQTARITLGCCLFFRNQFARYEDLQRAVRDSLIRTGQANHTNHALATVNLAEALVAQGRWEDARRYATEALPGAEPGLVRGNAVAVQGATDLGEGRLRDAIANLRAGIDEMAGDRRTATQNQDTIAWYRGKLLLALSQLEGADDVRAEARAVLSACRDRLDQVAALAARERSDIVANLQLQAEQVMAVRVARGDRELDRDLFEWLATLRAFTGPLEVSRLVAGPDRQRVEALRDDALRLRRKVAALSQLAPDDPLLPQATRERDAAERALLAALPAGSKLAWLQLPVLANELGKRNAVAVAVHRIRALPPLLPADRFFAFVLDGRAALRAVDLGPCPAIEQAIAAWRGTVIGTTRAPGRPVGGDQDPQRLGAALRALVLDPVLGAPKPVDAKTPGAPAKASRVFLCLDDVLNTIPWDALPLDGPTLVGDRWRLCVLPSLRDLLDARARRAPQADLVAFGDIDYDAPGAVAEGAPPADRPAQFGAQPFPHQPLLTWSASELESIGRMFEAAFRRKPQLVARGDATKAALFRLAPRARYLHVITHGYLAPDAVPMRGDVTAEGLGLATRGGFAPWTMCGLMLAGVNRPVGSLDEVPGIVTAEELAGLDLAGCQLAVLSGCETSLGSRRAGQGLASLQSALHAAGAATTVASLWEVPDRATAKLMGHFYRLLWQAQGKLDVDEALWRAKMELRKERPSPVEWAGWVLSGVPDGR